MPCLIQLTLKNGKPTHFDADQIYGIEKNHAGGSTLLLTTIEVLESYDEIKQKIEPAETFVTLARFGSH